MDVRMPDGTIIKNVPEGTTKAELQARLNGSRAKTPSVPSQLAAGAQNALAGIGKGLASIPDAAIQGFSGAMGLGLRAVGAGGAALAEGLGMDERAQEIRAQTSKYADPLLNPVTIGGVIDKVSPQPNLPGAGVARTAAEFGGALMSGRLPGAKEINALIPKAPVRVSAVQPSQGQKVAAAAQRQNVSVLPADVGGPATRRVTAATVQTPLGAKPIVQAAERSVQSAGVARDRIAQTAGNVTDAQGAGEIVQKGAANFSKKTAAIGGRLYDRAAKMAGDTPITPQKAVDALDQNIAELAQTPGTNTQALNILKSVRGDLVDEATGQAKPLTVQAIRNLRTSVRDRFLSEGLRGSDLERRVRQVVDAATDDISVSLTEQGKANAAVAYRRADQFWRGRVDEIDNVLSPILGKNKGGQQVFESVERLANNRGGDAKRLSRLMTNLSKEEAGSVRATIISRLGQAKPGAQDAAGEVFSPSTFLTRWNDMSPRAKAVLFADKELRSSLDDLATVTAGMREASKYANASQTGGVVGTLATGGLIGNIFWAPVTTTLALGAQVGAGKLMASPAFVKWLTRGQRLAQRNPAAIRGHITQLSAVAERQPAISNEVQALQQRLIEAMSGSPVMKAAADPSAPRATEE